MARIHRRTVQKDLHDPDNHDCVITDLEPDILECEDKAGGGDGIPVELLQPLKDDTVKVLHSAVATGLEKVSFHSNPKKGNAKECSNYRTIAPISR